MPAIASPAKWFHAMLGVSWCTIYPSVDPDFADGANLTWTNWHIYIQTDDLHTSSHETENLYIVCYFQHKGCHYKTHKLARDVYFQVAFSARWILGTVELLVSVELSYSIMP